MNTVKITRIEDVQVGDDVTLTRDGLTVAGRVRSEGTAVGSARRWRIYFPGLGTLYGRDGWTLVSATREVPDDAPRRAAQAKPVEAEKATTFTTPGGTHENDR